MQTAVTHRDHGAAGWTMAHCMDKMAHCLEMETTMEGEEKDLSHMAEVNILSYRRDWDKIHPRPKQQCLVEVC